jgi:exodeoxyribonuclease VIII
VQCGVYTFLTNEAYHASPGISNSGLGLIDRSPRHYYAWHLDPHRPPQPVRPGQLEGNLLHCALLEPDEFDKRYVVGPSVHRGTKIWKEWVAAHTDRIPIQADQRETAFAQAESALALPDVAAAVSKGMAEVSAYWNDPVTGVLCRCRPDFVHEAGSGVVLLDAKSYSSAEKYEFARQAARKGYHRQDALYSDGYEIAAAVSVLAFIFVVIEAEWPYAACAVMLDEASIRAGRALYRRNLDVYAQCLKTNTWPGYSSAIELVSLPNYALENYA